MWVKPLLIVGVLTLSSSSGESYNYHEDPKNAQETLLVLLIVFAFFFCVLVLIDIFNYMTCACCGRRINLRLTLNLLLIYHLQNRSPRYIFHQTKVKVVFISLHTPTILCCSGGITSVRRGVLPRGYGDLYLGQDCIKLSHCDQPVLIVLSNMYINEWSVLFCSFDNCTITIEI